jgi:transposase-like protein
MGENRKDAPMKRKYRRPEQIVRLLRQPQAKLAQGQTVDEMCRQLGISDGTYYYWRKQAFTMGNTGLL